MHGHAACAAFSRANVRSKSPRTIGRRGSAQTRARVGSSRGILRNCAERGGRRTEARLTDAGFAKLEEIAPGHVHEVHRLVFDVLTPEQLAALGDAARAITAATMAEAAEECREVSHC